MSAAEGMRSAGSWGVFESNSTDEDVGPVSGGFGVTLNMGIFSSKGHNHLATKQKGGGRAQVSRPVKFPKTRRARRRHAHSHHQVQADA